MLLSLINNILDFSRIEAGKDSLIKEILNLEEMILSIKKIYKTETAIKNIILFNSHQNMICN
jgi:signal transduction histidine kinase